MPRQQRRDLISRTRRLWRVVNQCRRCRVIGIDTEANSFWAYRERICLIQIIADGQVSLVDPLGLKDISPLGEVFHDPGIIKIFHGADYDLRCLHRDFNLHPAPIFDTMVAASLLNYPSLGLSALVKHHFGVDLPKTNALTRFDWATRPLPEKHLDYVINDVLYLLQLRDLLIEELKQKDLIEEAEWEFRQLEQSTRRRQGSELNSVLAIKGSKQLEPQELTVLNRLSEYRELYAERTDTPRFKVISNKALLEMARVQPQKQNQLKGISGVSSVVIGRHGAHLLEAIQAGQKDFQEGQLVAIPKPSLVRGPHMDSEFEARLKEWRAEEAAQRNISPQAVLPTSCLKDITRASHVDSMMLTQIPGMIPKRLERYEKTILELYQQEETD